MLKIVYGGSQYYNWDPKRGFSFEHVNVYESLRKIPNTRIIYFVYDRVREWGVERLNQELLNVVKKEKPDLFLSIMYYEDLSLQTLDELRRLTTTLGFFMDDHWHFHNSSKIAAPHLSWIATTYAPALRWYKDLGCRNVIKTHLGANHQVFQPAVTEPPLYRYDVSFVGAWYRNREKVVQILQKAGIRVAVWGPGWPAGRLPDEQMVPVVQQTKINIDINPPSSHVGLKPLVRLFLKRDDGKVIPDFSNFVNNVREWYQKRTPMIKPRTFNCLAARSFVITQMTHDLSEYYRIGKEIVAYTSVADLIEKITYYLSHEQERETIADAGYQRTIRDHTYERRFTEMVVRMGLGHKLS